MSYDTGSGDPPVDEEEPPSVPARPRTPRVRVGSVLIFIGGRIIVVVLSLFTVVVLLVGLVMGIGFADDAGNVIGSFGPVALIAVVLIAVADWQLLRALRHGARGDRGSLLVLMAVGGFVALAGVAQYVGIGIITIDDSVGVNLALHTGIVLAAGGLALGALLRWPTDSDPT